MKPANSNAARAPLALVKPAKRERTITVTGPIIVPRVRDWERELLADIFVDLLDELAPPDEASEP